MYLIDFMTGNAKLSLDLGIHDDVNNCSNYPLVPFFLLYFLLQQHLIAIIPCI